MLDIQSLLGGVSVATALLLIALIVFAESGLLIGLVLPGDTLLFTAGFFAAQGKLPLAWVILIIFIAACFGDNMGYFFGRKTGPRIFKRKDGIFFRREYIKRANKFYKKHGGKAVFLARFVPYIRTIAPIVAGIGHMDRRKFIAYNILGALAWTIAFVMLGYWLGIRVAEQIEDYLVPAMLVGLIFAFSPTIVHLFKTLKPKKK
jgi:membrane-associated protein